MRQVIDGIDQTVLLMDGDTHGRRDYVFIYAGHELGATVKGCTAGGPVDLKIPPNSQGGKKLRLKGRGLPGNPPGDQYVVLQMVTPPAQTEAQKALYEQMARELPFDPRRDM